MMMNDNAKDTKMTFQYGENVVVERKGKVYYGQIANVRKFETRNLITIKYTDGDDTWFRAYYDTDKDTKIVKDEVFA
jgi:hypothetical protein